MKGLSVMCAGKIRNPIAIWNLYDNWTWTSWWDFQLWTLWVYDVQEDGLIMHIYKKHKDIEQLDGISLDTEDTYAESYWERDFLGWVYQNYLDAIHNIKSSKLSIEEQPNEVKIAKDTRINDLLNNGYTKRDLEKMRMPPWTYSLKLQGVELLNCI